LEHGGTGYGLFGEEQAEYDPIEFLLRYPGIMVPSASFRAWRTRDEPIGFTPDL
jgi:hypothetical protein